MSTSPSFVRESTSRSIRELRKEGRVYFCDDLIVSGNPDDRLLAWLYLQFEKQDILKWLYHSRPVGLKEFINVHTSAEFQTLLCFKGDPADNRCIGFGFINDLVLFGENSEFKRANIGEAYLRGVSQEDTVSLAQMMIQWSFDILGVDALHGATPCPNRAAVRFAAIVGFNVQGPVEGYTSWHGKLCNVYVSSLTRSRWKDVSPFVEREG